MIHKKEFEYLGDLFREQMSTMVLLYGKPGTGKTFLVRQFMKDKKGFYFKCLSQHSPVQVDRFIRIVQRQYPEFTCDNYWNEFIPKLYELAQRDNLCIIWDDFPFLYKITQDILTLVEKNAVTSPFTIFITSSFPCANFIDFRFSTFSKNRFISLELKPLTFSQFRTHFPNITPIQAIEFYGITGGISRFIEWIDPKKSFMDNIRENFISEDRVPYYDPTSVLRYEFHEPSTYYSILQILAYHELKIGDLSHKLYLETHNLTSFVDRLREMKLIGRVVPGNSTNPTVTRKSRYMICDIFLYFWFRYVYFDPEALFLLNHDIILDHIQSDYYYFMDHVITEIVKEWFTNPKHTPFEPTLTSIWWDYSGHTVDILSTDQKKVVYADILFKDELYTSQHFDLFEKNTETVVFKNKLKQQYYYIFSYRGYSTEFRKKMKMRKTVKLMNLDDLVDG